MAFSCQKSTREQRAVRSGRGATDQIPDRECKLAQFPGKHAGAIFVFVEEITNFASCWNVAAVRCRQHLRALAWRRCCLVFFTREQERRVGPCEAAEPLGGGEKGEGKKEERKAVCRRCVFSEAKYLYQ